MFVCACFLGEEKKPCKGKKNYMLKKITTKTLTLFLINTNDHKKNNKNSNI